MLLQRVATALVGIPLVVLTIYAGGAWLAAVVAAAVAIAVLEVEAARGALRRPATMLACALAASLSPAALLGLDWMTWLATGVALLPVAILAFTKEPVRAVEEWLWVVALVMYFGWLGSHFVLLREVDGGRDWLLLVLLTVWITDTGAYAAGQTIGRHKLAPAVSPGKTWEGAIGGQISGLIAVAALSAVLGLDLATEHVVAIGLLAPLVAQIGDLSESALKRGLGVKDSSGLVPGHGGVADRLDSLLFATPVVYYYLQWIIL